MPGQRKRERGRERRRGSSEAEWGPGRWTVVFETADEARWRTEVRRRIAEHEVKDPSMFRLDTFCGRTRLPTTYRLSVFVQDGAAGLRR
ncbi:hypothetical protein ACIBLA_29185 [Streptomyces sp. NPDC050433]|uniref:hypothetical protein n=1 Tax=unclassified Streptomyces TaxID=2593676 RepID=UPI003424A254